MGKILAAAIIVFGPCLALRSWGAIWHVNGAVPEAGDGESWETAFKTIQEGIDAGTDGDTVLVAPATYVEHVHFKGKNILLRSTDPFDLNVVGKTIIDGSQSGSVVRFQGTENESCTLAGFTIRNGSAERGGGIRGRMYAEPTLATIRNNIISGNSAERAGGGVYGCNGRIRDNTISDNNAAFDGGGLAYCSGSIQNNIISGNIGQRGGGLYGCGGTIQNNTIAANCAGQGGGLHLCPGTIRDNDISGNSSEWGGGGLGLCDGIIHGNTILGNSAGRSGGGLSGCHGTIQNNTISGNAAEGYHGGGLAWCHGTVQNNAISGNTANYDGGGLHDCRGTIQNNTITANSSRRGRGLYGCSGRILNCIIWGNSATESGNQILESSLPTYSCIQEWTQGGTGNIEDDPLFMSPAAGDYNLQADSPCVDTGVNYHWFAWPQQDLDGNCRLVGDRVDMGCYEHRASRDSDGDLLSDIEEHPAGTNAYAHDTDGDGLPDGLELLRGSDPLQPTPPGIIRVPSDVPTIQASLCVALNGDEIIVSPGTYVENIHFRGKNVILRSADPINPAAVASTIVDGSESGSVVEFSGTENETCVLSGFTIQNGRASSGGGIQGGRLGDRVQATIEHNRILINTATITGGGLIACNGTIQKNIIANNRAVGGGGLYECSGMIQNNIIAGNWVEGAGGGLYGCDGIIQNNTIIANSAESPLGGGGLAWCNGTIRNCIIWGNACPLPGARYSQVFASRTPIYCCIEEWTSGGEGNFLRDPRFIGPPGPHDDPSMLDANDYRLRPDSPCIDAGDDGAPRLPRTDIAGMHRIMYGGNRLAVDIGAYEYYINEIEISRWGIPIVTWSSLSGKTYSVYWSADMAVWELVADNILSMGDTVTAWLDPTAPLSSPRVTRRYYRVKENEYRLPIQP